MNDSVELSIAAQKAAVRRSLSFVLTFFGAMLAALGLLGFLTVRSILQRLAKLQSVAGRLAAADIDGLTIDISGSDEIGGFGESMKGVHAAIEELSRIASYAQK